MMTEGGIPHGPGQIRRSAVQIIQNEDRMMTLNLATPDGWSLPAPQRSLFVTLSLMLHAGLILVVAIALAQRAADSDTVARLLKADKLIWMGREGLSGDVDGSVHRSVSPARGIRSPALNRVASADRRPPESHHDPVLAFVVPALPETADLRNLPGTVTALTMTDIGSPQAGSDDRGGRGGTGHGPGGNGGDGDGSGDSGSGPGSGMTPPELLQQVRPGYTADALRARTQGTVIVDAVVNADGSVGDVRIVRAFTPTFGLDGEAVRAVKQWRFRPASRRGRAVTTFVTIELTFSLR
jgi:TonB family protein